MQDQFICLGIESSCDDTAAAIITHGDGTANIASSVVFDQTKLHAQFGGVVPEIAARAHAEKLDHCIEMAVAQAGIALRDIDLISVTAGPGLIGGVLSGVMCAKGLAAGLGLPIIATNHLAGHALTPHLTDGLEFPYLLLLVSGGHCQFLIVKGAEDFERLGSTIDDAPGEAFDKTARILGLPQPGGPSVEKMAKAGDAKRFALPRPLLDRAGMDLSFSGLKTALMRATDGCITADGDLQQQDLADLSASFQAAVTDVLVEKSRRAIDAYMQVAPPRPSFAVAGGVAANQNLRNALQTLCNTHNISFAAPPMALCTDNAAMIAYAGLLQYQAARRDDLSFSARPRWPLDKTQSPVLGSGKKGAKA